MVEIEFTDPTVAFLLGMDLVDGYTDDILTEDGEPTNIKVFSIGFLFFKINIVTVVRP